MGKTNIRYWLCQILGWGVFGLIHIYFNLVVFAEQFAQHGGPKFPGKQGYIGNGPNWNRERAENYQAGYSPNRPVHIESFRGVRLVTNSSSIELGPGCHATER